MSDENEFGMDENADEADGFLPQQPEEGVKRSTGLRSLTAFLASFYSPTAKKGPSAKLLHSAAAGAVDVDDVDLTRPRPCRRKAESRRRYLPSLRLFTFALVFFALGIGIGGTLGLLVPYYGVSVPARPGLVDPPNTPAPFDAFGVPTTALPLLPAAQLTNATELDLETNFVVSRTPTLRAYELNISHALAAPDGVWKPVIVANGQSPGPLLEANTGDTLRVTMNNWMPNTTTSIHWHGINQYNSTWMDGVAGVSQCGIPPGGGSWVYEFVLTGQRGTFWWHAHQGVQFSDGLFGPIVSLS